MLPLKNFLKTIILIFLFLLASIGCTAFATAAATSNSVLQSQIDANNQQIINLNKKIADYQTALTKVGADKKTLQAAINALTLQRSKIETQIQVTQHQIDTTQLQIKQLGLNIVDTQNTIEDNQVALAESIRSLKRIDDQPIIEQILSSREMGDVWNDLAALSQIQNAINNRVEMLKTQKTKLANSQNASKQKQNTLTSQKEQLTSQQKSLVVTTQSKAQLLAETNAEESKYQKLLSAAKAELASYSTFAQNAGGSKLLTNQTSCDNWGCYYNQRDAIWGNNALNGTTYRLASDGCLVTSMAMIMTHYGHPNVTPQSINSNPDNFATYYPAFLLMTIYVDNATAVRKTATIDTVLATGNPIVVGLHAYGGTHFVVLTSGQNGKYLMRDPYIANAKDISFNDHYSVKNIYEIHKVEVNG